MRDRVADEMAIQMVRLASVLMKIDSWVSNLFYMGLVVITPRIG